MTIACGHLLVVDDERLNRMVLERALTEQGYSVETADNGAQALALLSRRPPIFDVVLLDVLMPELDGFQTLERIKADGLLAHVPVIMISALDDLDSVIRCIKLGATDYLPKPFNAAVLHARISASLAGKRLRDLELEYEALREREERLQRTVRELQIEIDQVRQSEKVAEITESEYFQRLRAQANELRQIMDGDC
jgi:DNA-binding response OmpR family regulator